MKTISALPLMILLNLSSSFADPIEDTCKVQMTIKSEKDPGKQYFIGVHFDLDENNHKKVSGVCYQDPNNTDANSQQRNYSRDDLSSPQVVRKQGIANLVRISLNDDNVLTMDYHQNAANIFKNTWKSIQYKFECDQADHCAVTDLTHKVSNFTFIYFTLSKGKYCGKVDPCGIRDVLPDGDTQYAEKDPNAVPAPAATVLPTAVPALGPGPVKVTNN